MQYKKGDYVKYSQSGVCVIKEIRSMKCLGKTQDFYVLKPINDSKSTVYVPVLNKELTEKMRYIMTKEEIDLLLKNIKLSEIVWIDDRKKRAQSFREILKHGSQHELISLVSCIYLKKNEFAENNKHLSATDENILSDAESIIENEFSFVLNLDRNSVGEYIKQRIF